MCNTNVRRKVWLYCEYMIQKLSCKIVTTSSSKLTGKRVTGGVISYWNQTQSHVMSNLKERSNESEHVTRMKVKVVTSRSWATRCAIERLRNNTVVTSHVRTRNVVTVVAVKMEARTWGLRQPASSWRRNLDARKWGRWRLPKNILKIMSIYYEVKRIVTMAPVLADCWCLSGFAHRSAVVDGD